MCEACDAATEGTSAKGRRVKIWEMNSGWHCAIIGTCLTLRDLRALGRKLGLEPRPGFPVDYQLHGHFVGQASERGKTAKLLNALLDRKHARAIRQLAKAGPEDFEAVWEAALEDGDIPGPFWAIMSHGQTPTPLAERMFADVHMLSHLVGASNRADIRRLNDLEEELEDARQDLGRERKRHADKMSEKTRAIDALQARLADLEAQPRAGAERMVTADAANDAAVSRHENEALRAELKEFRAELQRRDRVIADLTRDADGLREECAELESTLTALQYGGADDAANDPEPVNLGGRCILYVGGRPQCVNRYRQILERWNGELLHHDGGQEKSIHELASAIARADTVVFPCDCVSHDAVCNVKKLCRQLMKRYVPLRSSGLASLMAALKTGALDGANDYASENAPGYRDIN